MEFGKLSNKNSLGNKHNFSKIHNRYFQDRDSKTWIRVSYHGVFLFLNINQIYF